MRLRWVLIAALAALAGEIALLRLVGAELQAADCDLPRWLQRTVPLPPRAVATLQTLHRHSDSFLWLSIAAGFTAATDWADARELYAYLLVGHVLKNVLKAAIASPRGFWFCREGAALYCGQGYSLPSGHSMISLAMALFLLARWPRATWLRIVLPLLLAFVWFEVLYLGTHTRLDVLVGCTCGVAYFAAAALVRPRLVRMLRDTPWWALPAVFCTATGLVYVVEVVQDAIELRRELPAAWSDTYERYCRLPHGAGTAAMHLQSHHDKTALVAGLGVAVVASAWLAARQRGPDGTRARAGVHPLVQLVLGIGAGLTHLLARLAMLAVLGRHPLVSHVLPQLLQPSLALVLLPDGVTRLLDAVRRASRSTAIASSSVHRRHAPITHNPHPPPPPPWPAPASRRLAVAQPRQPRASRAGPGE